MEEYSSLGETNSREHKVTGTMYCKCKVCGRVTANKDSRVCWRCGDIEDKIQSALSTKTGRDWLIRKLRWYGVKSI